LLAVFIMIAALAYGQSSEEQYKKNCKRCHGEDGKGHTMVGKMVKASDLTSDKVSNATNAELAAVIDKGKGKMSGFGEKLGGEAGVANMVTYVRSLKK
jgi:mono/diheme cytochrome c family protein